MASYFGSYADYLCAFGAVSVCYLAVTAGRLAQRTASMIIQRYFPVDPKQYGRWAVVTGCTDGIGKSYALQLAEKGMDIVLISRNPEKLSAVAQEIVKRHQVLVKVITADFKKTDIYHNIQQQLSGLDIGVLVNNVGMANPRYPCYYLEVEDFEQYNRDIVNVNVLSCVMMTDIVLPEMVKRKRGAIINLSSVVGLRPIPLLSAYSATKVFIRYFSEALNMEYSSQGITIQTVLPCHVSTNMTNEATKISAFAKGWWYPSSDDYVRSALRTLGRESSTSAYVLHKLQSYLYLLAPDSVMTMAMKKTRDRMVEHLKKE